MSSTFIYYYCVAGNGIFMFSIELGMFNTRMFSSPLFSPETTRAREAEIEEKYTFTHIWRLEAEQQQWLAVARIVFFFVQQHFFIIGGLKALFPFHSISFLFLSSLVPCVLQRYRPCGVWACENNDHQQQAVEVKCNIAFLCLFSTTGSNGFKLSRGGSLFRYPICCE